MKAPSKNKKNTPILEYLKKSRVATILVIIVGLMVVLGGSSAYAANTNALPGSPLYPLKQIWQQASLIVALTPATKAQAQLNIAQDTIKSVQSNPAPSPVAAPALQKIQEQLKGALDQSKSVTDQTQRKQIEKKISDAATEAETEAKHQSDSQPSSSDKQDIQDTSKQIQQVKDQASTDD